jgi:hypothetical protein
VERSKSWPLLVQPREARGARVAKFAAEDQERCAIDDELA